MRQDLLGRLGAWWDQLVESDYARYRNESQECEAAFAAATVFAVS